MAAGKQFWSASVPRPVPECRIARRVTAAAVAAAIAATVSACTTLPRDAATATLAGAPVVTLPDTRRLDLRSSADGRVYRVFVALPEGPPPPGGYPVLYVLDGNALFPVAALMARAQARRSASTGIRPGIVVGIGYPTDEPYDEQARAFDYTPPAPGLSPEFGGGDAFLDFIERDLQPFIAREFPVDARRRTLFGHSFGGLLALHALFTRPGLFADYVAASPSIWWNDGFILKEREAFAARSTPRARVLVTVGSREQAPPTGASAERAALLRQRGQVDAARSLGLDLERLRPAGLQAGFREFEGENHGSAALPALQRAIEYALGQP